MLTATPLILVINTTEKELPTNEQLVTQGFARQIAQSRIVIVQSPTEHRRIKDNLGSQALNAATDRLLG